MDRERDPNGNRDVAKSNLLRALPRHNENSIMGMQTKLGRRRIRCKGYGMTNGYKVVFKNRRSIFEHRIIMWGMLGRRLNKNEVVYRINLDKSDNDPDNLDVLDGHDAH